MASRTTVRNVLLVAALSPLLLVVLVCFLIWFPFHCRWRLLLRLTVEIAWCARGRRILVVYSRSPVWQERIETEWLPRLGDRAVVLDWSDRATWGRWRPFAAVVFRCWAPEKSVNPLVVLFPVFPFVRHIEFYRSFHNWKHGDPSALYAAESSLFAFVDELR